MILCVLPISIALVTQGLFNPENMPALFTYDAIYVYSASTAQEASGHAANILETLQAGGLPDRLVESNRKSLSRQYEATTRVMRAIGKVLVYCAHNGTYSQLFAPILGRPGQNVIIRESQVEGVLLRDTGTDRDIQVRSPDSAAYFVDPSDRLMLARYLDPKVEIRRFSVLREAVRTEFVFDGGTMVLNASHLGNTSVYHLVSYRVPPNRAPLKRADYMLRSENSGDGASRKETLRVLRYDGKGSVAVTETLRLTGNDPAFIPTVPGFARINRQITDFRLNDGTQVRYAFNGVLPNTTELGQMGRVPIILSSSTSALNGPLASAGLILIGIGLLAKNRTRPLGTSRQLRR